VSRFKLKALTLRHPWVWACVYLGKDIENRGWKPYRPTLTHLAIHGGALPKGEAKTEDVFQDLEWITSTFPNHPEVQRVMSMGWRSDAQLDTICVTGIAAVYPWRGVTEQRTSLWHAAYHHGWRLEDGLILPTPLECKGRQGLWDVPEPQQTAIVHALHAARNPDPLFGGGA
jgi:hypothetical protein